MRDCLPRLPFVMLTSIITLLFAGCSGPLPYLTHRAFKTQAARAGTIGVMAPSISMYELQLKQLLLDFVPRDDWSRMTGQMLGEAITDEMAGLGMSFVSLAPGDDPGIDDLAALYHAVDLTIDHHNYLQRPPPRIGVSEAFPGNDRSFDFSLGSARDAMGRRGVDAVLFVTGYDFIPTTGAETFSSALTVISALGAARGGMVHELPPRFGIRFGLVDRDGRLLFYGMLDNEHATAACSTLHSARAAGDRCIRPSTTDLRDRDTAHQVARMLLDEYREATGK